MTVKEVSEQTGYSVLFLREWIAQDHPNHPFGIMVKMPGSKKRVFKINIEAFKKWKEGRISGGNC